MSEGQQCIIFFDWDDTLFPTSYLGQWSQEGDEKSSVEQTDLQKRLTELGNLLFALLSGCRALTEHVYIVTNSNNGWVQKSVQRAFAQTCPELAELLMGNDQTRIPIMEARTHFELFFPEQCGMWKSCAFQRHLELLQSGCSGPILWNNVSIVGIGDQITDRWALWNLTNLDLYKGVRIKSLQFKPNPSLIELQSQLKHVLHRLPSLVLHPETLDLQVHVVYPGDASQETVKKSEVAAENKPTKKPVVLV